MIRHLHSFALARSTHTIYSTGVRAYHRFCSQTLLPALPMVEATLQRFVASLTYRIAYKAIKVYLSGLQFWAIMNGDPALISSMSQLYYLLHGIRRLQGSSFNRPHRLPITITHMHIIHHRLQWLTYSIPEHLLFRTMTSLAFFGLLRSSEYTSLSRSSYAPHHTLLVHNISFSADFTIMHVFIRASKTDPFRSGCTIRIAAIADSLCAVHLMRQFLRSHPVGYGPLFTFGPRHYLIRQDVVTLLRRCLPSVVAINTHSFRIGGASTAASSGVPDNHIQILGRWSSQAYLRYLHLPDDIVS